MPEACALCGESASCHCAWAGPKVVTVPLFALHHGDRVLSFVNRCERYRVATIGKFTLTLHGKSSGKLLVRWNSRVNIERLIACELACCENHARDLGLGPNFKHFVCAYHWRPRIEAAC